MTDIPTALEAAVRRECRGQPCTYPVCPSDCGGLTYYGGERSPKALFERGWEAALLTMAERADRLGQLCHEASKAQRKLSGIANFTARLNDERARVYREEGAHARSLMAGTEKEKAS